MEDMTNTLPSSPALRLPEGLAAMPAPASALPAWDLSDLYPAIDSPRIAADLDAVEEVGESLCHKV